MKIKDWIFAISQLGDKETLVGDRTRKGDTMYFDLLIALKDGAPIGDFYEIDSYHTGYDEN